MKTIIDLLQSTAVLFVQYNIHSETFAKWQQRFPSRARALETMQERLQSIFLTSATEALDQARQFKSLSTQSLTHLDTHEVATLYQEKWELALHALPDETLLKEMLLSMPGFMQNLEKDVLPLALPLMHSFTQFRDLEYSLNYKGEMQDKIQKSIQDVCAYERNLFDQQPREADRLCLIENIFQSLNVAITHVFCQNNINDEDLEQAVLACIDRAVCFELEIKERDPHLNQYLWYLGNTIKKAVAKHFELLHRGSKQEASHSSKTTAERVH